jgi:hypothetical protein
MTPREKMSVGRVKLVAKEDLRRHACVRSTEGEATGLLLVAGGYAGKQKSVILRRPFAVMSRFSPLRS